MILPYICTYVDRWIAVNCNCGFCSLDKEDENKSCKPRRLLHLNKKRNVVTKGSLRLKYQREKQALRKFLMTVY